MRIAILMTNTDESGFAQRHPKDGEKFHDLMSLVRPDWEYPVFVVKDGEFPDNLVELDGAIITGSPASVNESAPWMARLEDLVRAFIAAGKPLFGACFGHQIMARALGGDVGDNPQGWVKGAVVAQYADGELPGYASHTEQVLHLPQGAETIAWTDGCPIAGFRVGTLVETTQYHPEMTEEFFIALLDEYGPKLPAEVEADARRSLAIKPRREAWAARIAAFFERVSEAGYRP
ncbi:MAG: type 1 glutamine amidotransferase [Pseudomonadota bacterium]